MERTKDRRGTSSVRTLPAAVRTGGFPPVPLFTGVCPFGYFVVAGGLNFDHASFYSRVLDPFAIKICKLLHATIHRLLHPYLFGAAVVAPGNCPAATVMPE